MFNEKPTADFFRLKKDAHGGIITERTIRNNQSTCTIPVQSAPWKWDTGATGQRTPGN